MSRRHPVLRMLVMVGAAIQLWSPGAAAVADGLIARESATQPLTHVEATTTSNCPVVHTPDCGVCRYLSSAATASRHAGLVAVLTGVIVPACAEALAPASVVTGLPNGRAPPVA